MRRKLFNIAAVLSLVLCVATVAIWIRSHRRSDELCWCSSTTGYIPVVSVQSGEGSAMFVYHPTLPKDRLTFHFQSTPINTFPGWDWPGTSALNRLGFYGRWGLDRVVFLPFWAVLLVSSFLPAIWLGCQRRRSRRRKLGRCLRCGYDLRATPDRCPECGTPACDPTAA